MFGHPKNIVIQTYHFECGLYYLGLSLAKHLESLGHRIYFFPKLKYRLSGAQYQKSYPVTVDSAGYPVLDLNLNQPTSLQVLEHFRKHQISILISLETLMTNTAWISQVKSKYRFKIIDVPMLEWVSPLFLEQKKYQIFDEIWALTDSTFEMFQSKNHFQTKRISWDFVDRDLFFPDPNPMRSLDFRFYHQASINPEYSSKNTSKVIEAFQKLANDFSDVHLTVTGRVKDQVNHPKIKYYSEMLSRSEIANLYQNMDCVVAPSEKEGLGLSLYEAQAAGCHLITTNAPPMNQISTPYLCSVDAYQSDKTLVPKAQLTSESIYQQMKRVYLENYEGEK